MEATTEPPPAFHPDSRKAISAWMASEALGKKVPGNPRVRLLHKDPQRQLYVAILASANPKKK